MNLLAASVLLLLVVLLFWPQRGVWHRWLRARQDGRRVQVEDALKHIYLCRYEGGGPTVQSLAGILARSVDDAAELSAQLVAHGLLKSGVGGLELTDDGRAYALQVIRAHRLWERYLADKTGLGEAEWHPRAEKAEHWLTSQEADELAARMGNPVFDPHGDPIPSTFGEMPKRKGQPLSGAPAGDYRIVHVEDEPALVYDQVVGAGLYPGMRIQVLDVLPECVRVEWGEGPRDLPAMMAANLTVEPSVGGPPRLSALWSLSGLGPGQRARIVDISPACRGLQRRRLLDLGFVPGSVVAAELEGPVGDPRAYWIRGALIALRREQADLIHIEPITAA